MSGPINLASPPPIEQSQRLFYPENESVSFILHFQYSGAASLAVCAPFTPRVHLFLETQSNHLPSSHVHVYYLFKKADVPRVLALYATLSETRTDRRADGILFQPIRIPVRAVSYNSARTRQSNSFPSESRYVHLYVCRYIFGPVWI